MDERYECRSLGTETLEQGVFSGQELNKSECPNKRNSAFISGPLVCQSFSSEPMKQPLWGEGISVCVQTHVSTHFCFSSYPLNNTNSTNTHAEQPFQLLFVLFCISRATIKSIEHKCKGIILTILILNKFYVSLQLVSAQTFIFVLVWDPPTSIMFLQPSVFPVSKGSLWARPALLMHTSTPLCSVLIAENMDKISSSLDRSHL